MARNIPTALKNHLKSGSTTVCALLRIEPVQPGFTSFGVTSADHDITYDDGNGPLLYSASIGYEPSSIQTSSDLSVTSTNAKSLMPVFDTEAREQDIIAGAYDYAKFYLYLINYNDLTSGNHIVLQTGTLGKNTVTDSGLSFTAELRGLTQTLKQSLTEKWSLSCRATFGSQPGGIDRYPCNFDIESLWQEGVVATVGIETDRTFTTGGLTPLYGGAPGVVKWLTGNNAGREDETEEFDVVGYTQTIGLTFGSMFPIQVGDTFMYRDDCPKTPTACKLRNNWQNYRGEPSIPVADNTALSAGNITTASGSVSTTTGDEDG